MTDDVGRASDRAPEPKSRFELLKRAKDAHRGWLLAMANVTGLDVGYRMKDGVRTTQLVVKVYVARKQPPEELAEDDRIPTTLTVGDQEVPVDVEVAAMLEAQ